MKTTLAVSILVLLAGCIRSSETPEERVARIGANVLAKDAVRTHMDFVAMHNAKGIPVDYDARIPAENWVGAIKDLAPAYVYYDDAGINMAIVLMSDHDTEEGIYVVPGYSSGSAENPNGISLSSKPVPGGSPYGSVYTFTRDLKQNSSMQPVP